MRSVNRMAVWWLLAASGSLVLASCGNQDHPTEIEVSGNAFAFAPPGFPGFGRIEGATISVLEMPGVATTTGEDGFFLFEGLPAGADATFVLEADGFPVANTRTFRLPDHDLGRVTFQVPTLELLAGLGGIAGVELDPERCQIASTVTVVGKSLYDPGPHGEAGAIVTIEPALDARQGPIYFDEDVLPDPSLTESSGDGGVAFVNVDPGEYTLTATKEGLEIESVRLNCRPGVLANASPPYGLQVLE
jgi:hypothetical protein